MKKYTQLSLLTLILSTATLSTSFANNNHAAHTTKASTAPANASVHIISPLNGATVEETFTIKFGIQGMEVSPAGIEKKNSGHHHLLVDGEKLPVLGQPMGGEVTHFGGGQTETELTLTKGEHTLQLILGDHNHVPFNPMVISKKITVTVK